MKQRIFLGFLSLGLVAVLAIGTSAFAQVDESNMSEEEVMTEGGMEVSISEVSLEEQEQSSLQAIAAQLQELEAEVNRLSLLVSKVVLERQALALQRQVEAMQQGGIAAIQPNAPEIVSPPIAMEEASESMPGEEETGTPVPTPTPSQAPVAQGGSVSDELDELPVPIVGVSDNEDEPQGFIAGIRNAIADLGAPELVTVFILAVLAIFVIVRRITSREKKQAPTPATAAPSTTQPAGQQALDQQRQELQERVAWK